LKSKKILATVVAAILATSVLAGCASKTPAPAPNTASESKMDANQTINIIGYDYKTLDPSLISDTESFTTLTQVYESLVRENVKDGVVVNEMAGAESFSVNADKTVYTYKLRKEAKWSDGKPVTAKDYVFSWKRLVDPRTAADYMTFLDEIGVKGAAEVIAAAEKGDAAIDAALAKLGIKAVDDYTFEVTLKQPTAYFESAVAFKCLAPQREDKFKELGKEYGSDPAKMVYNGAFTVSEYAKGSKIVYKKNPTYWNAKAIKLETAVGNIVDEPTTIVKMFDSGELDVAGASGEDLAKLKTRAKAGEFQYITGMDTSSFFNYLNVTRPVLKNAKVRQALTASVNRQQFLDVVYKRFVASNGLVPPEIGVSGKDYRKAVAEPLKEFKPADLKKLFMEGLAEEGITDAAKFQPVLLMSQANTTRKATAEYFQKTWKDTFGFELKINFTPDSQTYFTERQKGNFDIVAGGWGADYNDASSFFSVFLSGTANNNGKYNNPAYDKLVNDAAKETDADKRIELYKKAEKLLIVDDAAVIPTYYQDVNQFRKNYVKDFYLTKFGGYYDLYRTYIQGKK
jgi:oligopeptide transport system substrate-binding protein